MIRNIEIKDAKAVSKIYNHYVHNSIITFDIATINEQSMIKKIHQHNAHLPWLVYVKDGEILGYAYANSWKSRCAYELSVESTVYVKDGSHGKGIGTKLYAVLLDQLKKKNFHAVIGGISLPNPKSIALHEKFGFEKVAHFKEVGYKFDEYIDVGYWELILK